MDSVEPKDGSYQRAPDFANGSPELGTQVTSVAF